MALPVPEMQPYADRPGIFAVRMNDGRWQDHNLDSLAAEYVHWRSMAQVDSHAYGALQVQIQYATERLNEIDGIIPFTEALGKGDASEYDTELDWLVREACRLAAASANGHRFERWVLEKGDAEMSVDAAIEVRNMVEMDFDAYAGPNPSWGEDQALIDYRENMPALSAAFGALLVHFRAALSPLTPALVVGEDAISPELAKEIEDFIWAHNVTGNGEIRAVRLVKKLRELAGGEPQMDTNMRGILLNQAQVAIQNLLSTINMLLGKVPKSRLDGDDWEGIQSHKGGAESTLEWLTKEVNKIVASLPELPAAPTKEEAAGPRQKGGQQA